MSGLRKRERKNRERDREIQERALRESGFREALLADPRGTLEREFGAVLPEGLTVKVHEESANTIHLVIPGSSVDGDDLDDLDDPVHMLPDQKKSKCCTCGSSTHQTFNI